MSQKRSDRLRSIIAATVTDAAENAAPVTVTGSGIAADIGDSGFKPPTSMEPERVPAERQITRSQPLQTRSETDAPERTAGDASLQPELTVTSSDSSMAVEARTSDTSEKRAHVQAALRAPERAAKLPKWEKANVTLEPRDLAILQRSDVQARAYGFRIRKGGNPSLFVRAGLRLLDELVDCDPEAWVQRIAATTLLGTDKIE